MNILFNEAVKTLLIFHSKWTNSLSTKTEIHQDNVWQWHSRQSVIPLDSQQTGKLAQAVQLLGWKMRRLVLSGQQVSPDVLLLQAGEDMLDLEHHAQAPPLRLHLHHLLLLHHPPLSPQQLQDDSRSLRDVFLNYHCRHCVFPTLACEISGKF